MRAQPDTLTDRLGRPIRDLRISVTDRCNFRCTYCMPKEIFGSRYQFMDRKSLLTFEEIERVASIFIDAGVRKIRLTGGEPLIRRDLPHLVEKLARLDGLEDLSLTSNGSLITARAARSLADAGLRRLTLSLDAIDDTTFRSMNDVGFSVEPVLAAVDHAAAAGLAPIKVNMVVKRGTNDHDVVEMARHFRGTGHIVRFIEFMDVGNSNGWRMDDVLPAADIVARIDAAFPLEPLEANYRGEVASRWRYRDGAGEIGVIASVTQPFCSSCTRARLSAEGKLYTCLFAGTGHDLRAPLRDGTSDAALRAKLASLWAARNDRYSEIRTAGGITAPKIEMSYIGG